MVRHLDADGGAISARERHRCGCPLALTAVARRHERQQAAALAALLQYFRVRTNQIIQT